MDGALLLTSAKRRAARVRASGPLIEFELPQCRRAGTAAPDPQETSIGTLPDHPGFQHRRRGAAPMLRIVERADRPASWGRTKGEKPTTRGKGGALFSSTSVTMARISLVVAGLSEELADQEVVSLPSFVGRPAVCQVRPTAQVGFSLLDRRRRSGL